MPPKAIKTAKEPGASQPLIRSALHGAAAASIPASPPSVVSEAPAPLLEDASVIPRIVQAVLEELKSLIKVELQEMRAEMIRELAATRTEFSTLKTTVSDMEHALTACSDDVTTLRREMDALKKEVTALNAKCDDLESRSRRQNIRIIGVPEDGSFSLSGSSVSDLLKRALDLEKAPVIDRAHRSLGPRKGEAPRPIVARLHYYSDCAEILTRARQRQWITLTGMKIAVFPDYTAKVAKERAAFNEVRNLLRSKEGVKYSLLFPVRLRLTHNGIQRIFTSADEAKEFISTLPA